MQYNATEQHVADVQIFVIFLTISLLGPLKGCHSNDVQEALFHIPAKRYQSLLGGLPPHVVVLMWGVLPLFVIVMWGGTPTTVVHHDGFSS